MTGEGKNLNKGSVKNNDYDDDDDESSGKLILFLFQRQNYQNQITQNVFFVNFFRRKYQRRMLLYGNRVRSPRTPWPSS